MDLAKVANPFDFANPVVDPALFVGRATEMTEIKYYLDHASRAARPINLAIIGGRASGKTSVLNMIEIESQKREFCVVRIDLDEGDAQTQLAFFYKIFDSLLTIACSHGAYGGIQGETYNVYRNMVDAYEIPDDKIFCPFIFPIQYANAMSKGNINLPLSDTIFKIDLATIHNELQRLVALLFDEGDVLAKSRIHLEKMRNIFMNIPGYMLVLIGTPALFPVMDDVFSPIVRQFKKINIGPFRGQEDTQECIRKHLEQIGITQAEEIFDIETYHDVSEIHDLSGGRPYEIQLICHFMFKRIQQARTTRMELTLDVLEDVRKELESAQDVSIRPVLTAVLGYSKDQLSALHLLCACNGRANFEQIWFSEYVLRDEKRWTREVLLAHLVKFQEAAVISVTDDLISFVGDDFDRIYCKYLARTHSVRLSIDDIPYEVYLSIRLDANVEVRGKIRELFPLWVDAPEGREIEEIAYKLCGNGKDTDPFRSRPDIATGLYWGSIDFRECENFQVAAVTLISPWRRVQRWYRLANRKVASEISLSDVGSMVEGISERASNVAGTIVFEIKTLPVAPLEVLLKKVEDSSNANMRGSIYGRHYIQAYHKYVDDGDIREALFNGEIAHRYDPTASIANNLGYLYIVQGDFDKARGFLEEAARKHDDPKSCGLPTYNLGIVEMKLGNLGQALTKFTNAAEIIESGNKRERTMGCLFIPKISPDTQELEFEEVKSVDLFDKSKEAASVVEKLLEIR